MASDSDLSPAATVSDQPAFSATQLASEMIAVTRTVLRQGAAVITKHQQPVVARPSRLCCSGAPCAAPGFI